MKLNEKIRVTAIVSVYNAERFIQGCLDSLLAQTLSDTLEIIVIDACSQQGEHVIVQEYKKRHPNILYVRTTERESVYASWNRGVRMARGSFVTNANSDDRHRPDALEQMATILEEYTEIDYVYGDYFVGNTENETFKNNNGQRILLFPDFFAPAPLLYCQFGPQPLWRKKVHDKIGYFDESYRACADWDFNIRLTSCCQGMHIQKTLGLYLEHEAAITFRDDTMLRENVRIKRRWQNPTAVEERYISTGIIPSSSLQRALIHLDMGIRAMRYYPPWGYGSPENNLPFARRCFKHALRITPTLKLAQEFISLSDNDLATLTDFPSPLRLPTQAELSGFFHPQKTC